VVSSARILGPGLHDRGGPLGPAEDQQIEVGDEPAGELELGEPLRVAYRYGMLFGMPTEQIAVRLPEDLLERVDQLVDDGVYESRAAAVRAALELLAEFARRRVLEDAIVQGYQRLPPTPAERASALASLRDAIAEEPW
jgi:Arc/MetJ-type ribon-helix-helix transcriptional regulator